MWLRGASLQHDEGAGRTSRLQRTATGGGWGDGRLQNLAGELQGPAVCPWPQAHSWMPPQQRQPSRGQWHLEAGKDRHLVLEQSPGLGLPAQALPVPMPVSQPFCGPQGLLPCLTDCSQPQGDSKSQIPAPPRMCQWSGSSASVFTAVKRGPWSLGGFSVWQKGQALGLWS